MINVQFKYKIMLVSPIPTIYGPRPCAPPCHPVTTSQPPAEYCDCTLALTEKDIVKCYFFVHHYNASTR